MKKLKSLILLCCLFCIGTTALLAQSPNNCTISVWTPPTATGPFFVVFETTNTGASGNIVRFEAVFNGNIEIHNTNIAGNVKSGMAYFLVDGNTPTGSQPITVRAYSANNVLQADTVINITIGQAQATNLQLTVNPNPVFIQNDVDATFICTNPSGNTTIRWGDGLTDVVPQSANGTRTHSYITPGNYVVSVINNDDVKATLVTASPPPSGSLSINTNAPDTVVTGVPFFVPYQILNPNLSFSVNWGDGTNGPLYNTDSLAVHIYTDPGIYITTYSAQGTAHAIDTIVAVDAPELPMQIVSPMGGEVFDAGTTDTLAINTTLTGQMLYILLDSLGHYVASGTANAPVLTNGNLQKYLINWPLTSIGNYTIAAYIHGANGYGADTSNTISVQNRIVEGFIYYDFNSNNVFDNTDWPFVPSAFNVSTGAHNLQADMLGNYKLSGMQPGTITVAPALPVNFTVQPAQYSIDVTNPGTFTGYDFALQPLAGATDFDLMVDVYRSSNTSAQNTYARIRVKNMGPAMSLPTTITYLYNPAEITVISTMPAAATQQPGTITFTVPPIQPGLDIIFNIREIITMPVGAIIGESASLPPIDVDPNNNGDENIFTVIGAVDPNAITASPSVIFTPHNVEPGYITYFAQFQNTGNGEAVNIRINDTIAANLDMSTFEVLESSHTMNYIVRPGGVVDFYFPNIMLPDSNVNEPGSHGHILYRIKPIGSLPLGSSTDARVGIYFDYNEAVVTNTASTVVLEPLGVEENATANFSLFPNPSNGMVYIQPNAVYQNSKLTLRIFAADGRVVKEEVLQPKNQHTIDISKLSNGIYNIQLMDGKTQSSQTLIKN